MATLVHVEGFWSGVIAESAAPSDIHAALVACGVPYGSRYHVEASAGGTVTTFIFTKLREVYCHETPTCDGGRTIQFRRMGTSALVNPSPLGHCYIRYNALGQVISRERAT